LNEPRIRGVWCATLTPLGPGGDIDTARWRDHVQMLLRTGIDGIAPFGTTGEGQSFTVAERRAGVDALIGAGIDPLRIVPGTGCAAIADAIELSRHAVQSGCLGALVLPPFFLKGIGDDGVYASYARLIEGVRDERLRVYLYHIPQVTSVPIGDGAIARLLDAFPGVIAGIKDSSGDLAHSRELVRRFPSLNVLVGHEPHLQKLLLAGGAGTIGGLANLYPETLRRLHDAPTDAAPLDFVQRLVEILRQYSMMPAIKAMRALLSNDAAWCTVREPLIALDEEERRTLAAAVGVLSDGKAA